ncbi:MULTISPECIES: hypothetical protein [Methylosinus]|uniref:Uncharacterized protein n=1 Tax=Methylosinus trichosporium (strain ATCC 35070 / NCIMB 11131 / UNIQEM 75 / OB3b) TaxID=595536 RepID=A0A2D2D0S4_METT3|nr:MULTISPECIES: hypothetical protein [Methylosinus]ATQ68580.1 hypothetical protein CQW49_12320 [Methylosinus trichosporium OB3b]OBS51035.1 hypothetical protein A8B73_18605 [Methylosinus sp. 3S-1]
MSQIVEVAATEHRAFGALATISAGDHPPRRLTRQEAGILSRALTAVAEGASAERQIFMSPIASDHEFEAEVRDDGVTLRAAGCADILLDWTQTRILAAALAEFAG